MVILRSDDAVVTSVYEVMLQSYLQSRSSIIGSKQECGEFKRRQRGVGEGGAGRHESNANKSDESIAVQMRCKNVNSK